MRLWSIHPEYLDSKGLVAVWREGLLALSVLKGNTKGYRSHPQLERFKATRNPVNELKCYLRQIYLEAEKRGYRFDLTKLGKIGKCEPMKVTRGQLIYEMDLLKSKLANRDLNKLKSLRTKVLPKPHSLFSAVDGDIEKWERIRREVGSLSLGNRV